MLQYIYIHLIAPVNFILRLSEWNRNSFVTMITTDKILFWIFIHVTGGQQNGIFSPIPPEIWVKKGCFVLDKSLNMQG